MSERWLRRYYRVTDTLRYWWCRLACALVGHTWYPSPGRLMCERCGQYNAIERSDDE